VEAVEFSFDQGVRGEQGEGAEKGERTRGCRVIDGARAEGAA